MLYLRIVTHHIFKAVASGQTLIAFGNNSQIIYPINCSQYIADVKTLLKSIDDYVYRYCLQQTGIISRVIRDSNQPNEFYITESIQKGYRRFSIEVQPADSAYAKGLAKIIDFAFGETIDIGLIQQAAGE